MDKDKITIVLTGGGSGGHITPILSLAHELKASHPKPRLIYIGLKGDKVRLSKTQLDIFDKAFFISSGKFRRYHGRRLGERIADIRTIFLNMRDFFRFLVGLVSAYRLLGKLKPNVVFSKGGFVVVPVGIAARLKHIPIVTHDSDAMPGLANRILGRWAAVQTTGMPFGPYKYPAAKARYVGIPVQAEFNSIDKQTKAIYRRQLKLALDSKVILIAGGGLGAAEVNQQILTIADKLLGAEPKLELLHLAGAEHQQALETEYRALLDMAQQARVRVLGFVNDLYRYSGAADLIVSRAGATAIAEFAAQAKACILIPSTFLSGGHQLKNAESLKKLGVVEVVEKDDSPQELLNKIRRLLNDDQKRSKLGHALADTIKHDGTSELAKILIRVSQGLEV